MPGSLVGAGLADQVMPLDTIGAAIAAAVSDLSGGRSPAATRPILGGTRG